jgi:GTP-binding protein EngB required for normal cell division
VIHLVRGEPPSFTVNAPTRSLDPWDIPDAAEDSADSSNQNNNKDIIYGNEAERGINNQWEKQTYTSSCSKTGFSNAEDCNASNTQYQVEMDEKDQSDDDDGEFWEDEDETEEEDEDEDADADEDREEEDDIQYSVAEMTRAGQRLIVARGGEGGLGNASIGNDVHLSKEDRQQKIFRLSAGEPGTEAFLVLELKSIADVGLVGLPNAGKSTLLSALSKARPEIADYAFTTLRPNIGSLTYDDYFSVKVADIPGLIKGAHENRGLGHDFLRHIERTKVLSYVLDLAATLNGRKGIPPWEQLHDLVVELEHYQEGLTKRPSLIVANKIDEDGKQRLFIAWLVPAPRRYRWRGSTQFHTLSQCIWP